MDFLTRYSCSCNTGYCKLLRSTLTCRRCDENLPDFAVFDAVCFENYIMGFNPLFRGVCCLPAWVFPLLNVELVHKVDGFPKRSFRYGFSSNVSL